MEIELDYTKSAQQNANDYYNKSKKLLHRKEGAEKAVKELNERLSKLQSIKKPERKIIKTADKEWFEKFHWFYTSNDLLVIGGRDAHQNEMINSRYFDENDLFFHADIFGASAVVLKNGLLAAKEVRTEVAEFAACYSSAWKENLHSIDVYAMRRDQVSKSSGKGSLGTGSFLLTGEREWYRNMQLSIVMYVNEGRLITKPLETFKKSKSSIIYVKISQGNFKKSDAAKKISAKLGYKDIDTIMRQLPTGGFRVE